jgi:hypothetical protein
MALFDGQAIVFHHGTGETHHLEKSASTILSIIMDSQLPIIKSALLEMAIGTGVGSFDEQTLSDILAVLQDLHIIENI